MIKVAVIGFGNRGRIYASQFDKNDRAEVVAVCEKKPRLLDAAKSRYNLKEGMAFASEDDFFAAGKLADALVVASQDRDHYGHAIKGLQNGYHLLLEKPVSPVLSECEEIAALAKEKNLKVVVCHVLRYSPFYNKIKEVIDSGAIGEVVSINDTENVGYWHFSHSYVRGNWRKESETAPSILAKCCHDLDLIYYLGGKKCEKVSSYGSRRVFLPENAPEGATDYCLAPCPHSKECVYHVRKIYYGFTRYTVPKLIVNGKLITEKGKFTIRELKEALKTSPYGRCVYKCDNDVMENQVVSMQLEGGLNASLMMTAFSKRCYRKIYVSGTKGEIIGNDIDGKFKVNIFGGPVKTVRVGISGVLGHLGGDMMIVKDFVDYLITGKKTPKLSLIETTLESHRMAFAAEESRKSGKTISLKG
ncbi:MAG: Gfo/Idh/MocA family oxidoreductase [Clostridia bacterium]